MDLEAPLLVTPKMKLTILVPDSPAEQKATLTELCDISAGELVIPLFKLNSKYT